MSKSQIGILIFAVLMMGIGAYIAFGQGEPLGAVFLGTGATFAALSTIVGTLQNKIKQEQDDAG